MLPDKWAAKKGSYAMKNPSVSKHPKRPQTGREGRRRALKNLILGVPVLLISILCLVFLFNLVRALHKQSHMTLNTDTSLVVQNGDTVSIDFVGTIDGEEFQGSSTNGKSEQLLIGSGSYIDDFEEQLIGHHVGETVQVAVTFPEDYPDDTLRNIEAVYDTTINGIYQ